jgi:hypothetical protein
MPTPGIEPRPSSPKPVAMLNELPYLPSLEVCDYQLQTQGMTAWL